MPTRVYMGPCLKVFSCDVEIFGYSYATYNMIFTLASLQRTKLIVNTIAKENVKSSTKRCTCRPTSSVTGYIAKSGPKQQNQEGTKLTCQHELFEI